ncbi:MAG: glycoside hydrolase family 2 TIM barrel-domain containing protein, partial [Pseudomonadota bacterium]
MVSLNQVCKIGVITLTLLFFNCSQNKNNIQNETRVSKIINKDWNFQIGDTIDNSDWSKVNIPHTPKIEPLVVNNQWQGVCWYRKVLSNDFLTKNRNHFVKFEGVMQKSTVWINSIEVAHHKGGYLPFTIDISEYIDYDKEDNTIIVKVVNTDDTTIPPGKPLKDLDFNLYGGIYRNVHLISTDNIYITDAVASNKVNSGGVLVHFDKVSESKAEGFAKVHIQNDTDEEKQLKSIIRWSTNNSRDSIIGDIFNIKPRSDIANKIVIDIQNPLLWSPETPNLYDFGIEIIDVKADRIVDKKRLKTGIRSIVLNEEGFFLNGKKRFINGTNRHQEYPYVGYAISDNANYRDAYKIKQAGFDFVRLSHYPHSTSFLEACDELGLMVMNCIPGWQFFEEGEFEKNAYQDIKDFIRRDRNHPSVIFWENSLNESWMKGDFIPNANAIANAELPYIDTYTAGWTDHEAYDLFIPARQHSKPPNYWNDYDNNNRQILIAEYGDWEYYAQNAGFNQTEFKNLKEEERSSRQLRAYGEKRLLQQALNYQEAFNSNLQGQNTIGHANWLMFDYNRGYADDIEASGISDIFRIPKFAHYFYKSQKSSAVDRFSEPMVYIASHWNKNSFTNLKVYSNCEELALYLDDKLIEKKSYSRDKYSSHLKHPPFNFNLQSFKPGTLKAVGYIDNKQVAEHTISTVSKPNKLQLEVDTSGKKIIKGEDDIVFVYASIFDENNNLVNDAKNEISFSIENDFAEIIGPKRINAEAGIATILVRTNYTKEPIVLKAEADII